MVRVRQLAVVLVSFMLSDIWGACAQLSERKIKERILYKYNVTDPPQSAQNGPIKLSMEIQVKGFSLQNTYFGSSDAVKLTLTASVPMTWIDERLKWNSSDFPQSETVFVKESEVWSPNFGLDITFDENGIHCGTGKCFVHISGKVTCVSRCTFPAMCSYDVRQWPYGIVSCALKLGSWDRIDGNTVMENFDTYVIAERGLQNPHWKMLSIASSKTSKTSALHNKTFTVIVVKFIVERISTLYDICITMPAFVMASVNLVVLWLPLKSNMRYVVLMVILHAHYIFLQQLSWLAPSSGDDTPFVLIFFRNSLFVTASMLVFVTISRNLAARQYPVPRWLDIAMNLIDSQPLVAMLFPTTADASMKSHDISEDGTSLVNEVGPDPLAVTYNYHWRRVCLILERICFVTLTVAYAIMLLVLLPSGNSHPDKLVPPVTKFME
ncbi:neuronal acetylcholine receptor subunit alpha-7-like [Culex pipiens pallens]|uniref:neuronal acetylcholine receptor subunit alpha-7-like n=1 Tax=Culex pipiens pallens TaxID=42434 RepID=UPI001952D894|nr:neuronal acetylcholine receptor subunit alpha-7-like [Culex pipiens pallens]